jgi:hypothetical protein
MRLPFCLKLVAVLMVIGGLQSILFDQDWLARVLGAAGIAAGIGMLLRKKWAWLLAIVITTFRIVLCLASLVFFRQFYDVLLGLDATFRVVFLCFTVAGYMYLGFSACYLTRSRIRSLFGIGSPRP